MNKGTAFVVIDVQVGMFAEDDPVYNGSELLSTLQTLIARARTAGIPLIYVQHDGKGEENPLRPDRPGWSIHPAIQPFEDDVIIRKQHPDAFQDTGMQNKLDALGIQHLIVVGIQTEFCVDTTCRRAYSLGYQVTLVEDAHSTWDTGSLTAPQIITHHNLVLNDWFVRLVPSAALHFDEQEV